MEIGVAVYDIDDIARTAADVEGLGFDYLACGEHLFFHGASPNSIVALAVAAGATQSIRLLSSIALAPLYPAALFAKLVSVLDRASHGRLELGVGAGGENPAEFEAVGVDPATRYDRLEESLTVMERLFTGEPTTFEGKYTRLSGQNLNPLLGTPDEARHKLADYAAAGATRAILSMAAPKSHHRRVMTTLAQDLLPALRTSPR